MAEELDATAIFSGYVAHALLFYRQSHLSCFGELLDIGRKFPVPQTDNIVRPGADDKRALKLISRGLRKHERYWGSIRMGAASLAAFEKATELAPRNPWAELLCGMTHEMHRRYTKAIRHLDRAHALAPRCGWPLILRGVCKWYQAEFRAASKDFERAARLMPDSDLPLLFLSRSKADYRDRSLIKDLNRALRLAPRSGFALSWRGRAFSIVGKTQRALSDLKRSIELLPGYDRGYSWLGASYVEQGRFREAIPLLTKARALNPYYPTTLYPLARALGRSNRWAEAGEALKAAAFIDRQGIWVEHRISMSHPNPACLRSLIDLDAYLEKFPKAAWAWAWRGQTRLLLQDYRGALADLDAAAAFAPKDAWTFVWRGEARRRLGIPDAALADFKRAPGLTWSMAGRGWCLLSLGFPKQALPWLDQSLRLQPHCAPALAWRGETLYALGRHKAAAADVEAALELHPQDHWLYDLLWRIKSRLGDLKGVREALARLSADGGAQSDEAWALLGWAESRLGHRAEAKRAFARALELNPRQPIRGSLRFAQIEALLRRRDPALFFSTGNLQEYCRRSQPPAVLAALRARNFVAALARCEGAPSRYRDVRSTLFRGWLKLKTGDRFGAVEEASRVLDMTLDPNSPPARWLRQEAGR